MPSPNVALAASVICNRLLRWETCAMRADALFVDLTQLTVPVGIGDQQSLLQD